MRRSAARRAREQVWQVPPVPTGRSRRRAEERDSGRRSGRRRQVRAGAGRPTRPAGSGDRKQAVERGRLRQIEAKLARPLTRASRSLAKPELAGSALGRALGLGLASRAERGAKEQAARARRPCADGREWPRDGRRWVQLAMQASPSRPQGAEVSRACSRGGWRASRPAAARAARDRAAQADWRSSPRAEEPRLGEVRAAEARPEGPGPPPWARTCWGPGWSPRRVALQLPRRARS
jgi:hypothetical protein